MGDKKIVCEQLALVLGRTPESEKGGRLGHYLDIIEGTPAILKSLPDIKKENLIVIVPFINAHVSDDWKARMSKVESFLKEKGITHHCCKHGGRDEIAIDYSEGDNAEKIAKLYEESEILEKARKSSPKHR
ncbi:MAG: hypothetical protein AABY33_05605 [Pseudomonadota bacterium]|mgnify:CR=1 FL=1